MTSRHTRRFMAGVAAAAILAAASAALAADLRGAVTDADTASGLPAATVRVVETGATAVAGSDGRFTLRGLAPGQYTIVVTYVGYPDATQTVTVAEDGASLSISMMRESASEEVVVVGERRAQAVALQDKKQADNVVETLYANDAGKLPDQNIGESLRRLPGLTIANDQGEGRYILIRGVDPNLVNVTINGATTGAPEEGGRQVKSDDIPTALVASVTVVKSLTPDLDANAIAGSVDIKTLSAFDRDGSFLSIRGGGGYFALNHKVSSDADISGGARFGDHDEFGLVLAANYSDRKFESENVQTPGNWINRNGYIVPDDFRLRDYNLERTRWGLVGNFDWRPDEATKLFVRAFYANYRDSETRDQFRIELTQGGGNQTINQTPTSGTFTTGRGTRLVRQRVEQEEIFSIGTGGSYESGDDEFSLEASYTRARKKDPARNEWEFRSSSNAAFATNYDLSGDMPVVTPVGATPYDPTAFTFRRVRYVSRIAEEDLVQVKGDWQRWLEIGGGEGYLKAGFKVLDRQKTFDQTADYYNAAGGALAFNLSAVVGAGKYAIYDGDYRFGPRVDYPLAQAYFAANPARFVRDVNGSAYESLFTDYEADERIIAGYVMANLKFGDLTVVPGVRVENTEATYRGRILQPSAPVDNGFNNVVDRSYTDWFPSLNAKYEVDENLLFRVAVTTAIGRPNYEDLAPNILIDGTSITLGDPGLSPLKSVNYDATVEYYLPGQGIIALSAFYKDIDDPIYRRTTNEIDYAVPGQIFPVATVSAPFNAESGKAYGVELNVQSQFTFLPEPFDGLGIAGNIAYIESEANGLAGRTDAVPLFGQARWVGTIQLFYEKEGLAARLAYSYRSKILDSVGATAATDIYWDNTGTLDARVSYAFSDSAAVYVEGSNLTDEPWRTFIGVKNQLGENERYGRQFRAGVQLAF